MKSSKHDIYFVDYRLDKVDGLYILRQAVALGCHSPIVLLTGQGDKEVDFKEYTDCFIIVLWEMH